MVREVAYEMGKNCPIGREVELVIGLLTRWPDLQKREAHDDFKRGLADRFAANVQPA